MKIPGRVIVGAKYRRKIDSFSSAGSKPPSGKAGRAAISPPGLADLTSPVRSQRNPCAEEPEAPGTTALVPVRCNLLALPVEGLMVEASILYAAP